MTKSAHTAARVLIIVLTAAKNIERRTAIRATWAHGHSNVKFITGSDVPAPDSNREDLIIVQSPDNYTSLASKLLKSYKWAVETWDVSWVLKVDDDCYVDVPTLHRFVLNLKPQKTVIAAGFTYNGRPQRSGKYAEVSYKEEFYKPYPDGAGHLVSFDLVKWIAAQHTLPLHAGEDTSLGSWVAAMPFDVKLRATPKFVPWNERPCRDHRVIVLSHNLTPRQLKQCYAARLYKSQRWNIYKAIN